MRIICTHPTPIIELILTRRIQELESDEFAGFVLERLGASLSDALSGVQSLSDKDDSYSTHPRRSRRIAAIKKGFKESGGYVNSSNLNISKGKTVDSKYSNSRYSGVEYRVLNDYYTDGIYTGYVSIKSQIPFGYGEWRGENGSVYEGEVVDGEWNGYGKYTQADGAVYEGYFVNFYKTGAGVYTLTNGTFESGNFLQGQLNGKGKRTFKSGSVLEGTFLNGKIIKCLYNLNGKSKELLEIGFLDSSRGQGMATFTTIYGDTYKGKFKDGKVDGQAIKRDITKGRKKYRQVGLARFIPKIVLDELNFNYKNLGYLVKTTANGSLIKAYYEENFIWNPIRSGYCEEFAKENYYLIDETEQQYDKFIGIYWNGERNGYGIKYKDGKVVEKGIYQDGNFIKSEHFDLELMQKTFKKWY